MVYYSLYNYHTRLFLDTVSNKYLDDVIDDSITKIKSCLNQSIIFKTIISI